MKIDMHSHSYYSDGVLSPSALVMLAKQEQCSVLALADHDTTAGIIEAKEQANKDNINLVNAVEISAMWGKHTVHIIGLGIDIETSELQQGLQYHQEFRGKRAIEMAQGLEYYGIKDAYNKACKLSKKSLLTRTHFAKMLIAEGYCRNMGAVFKKFLTHNKPGNVVAKWQDYKEVITWIKNAGGLSVLAHPFRYRFSNSKINSLLLDFKNSGGDALEVVVSSSTKDEIAGASELAILHNLLASAGSDYHGWAGEYRQLGKLAPMPAGLNTVWQKLTITGVN